MSNFSDFSYKIKALATQSENTASKRGSERATDTWIIQPFIRALGFDTSNPAGVVPEYTADVGIKSGEKVDYAIIKDGSPIIFIEIKAITENLNASHMGQLYRYFGTTSNVRIAILTNGKEAWFYSDLDIPNVMDKKPFFKFNFQNNSETDIHFLHFFCKDQFSINEIIRQAEGMKNLEKIKSYLKNNIMNPDQEFTRFVCKNITGRSPRVQEMEIFQNAIKTAFNEITAGTPANQNIISAPPHAITAISQDKKPKVNNEFKNLNEYIEFYKIDAEIQKVINFFDSSIMALGDISRILKETFVGYSVNGVIFASIQSRYTKIMWLNIKHNELSRIRDYHDLCNFVGVSEVTGKIKGHLCQGDIRVQLDKIDYTSHKNNIMDIIQQVYDMKRNG